MPPVAASWLSTDAARAQTVQVAEQRWRMVCHYVAAVTESKLPSNRSGTIAWTAGFEAFSSAFSRRIRQVRCRQPWLQGISESLVVLNTAYIVVFER